MPPYACADGIRDRRNAGNRPDPAARPGSLGGTTASITSGISPVSELSPVLPSVKADKHRQRGEDGLPQAPRICARITTNGPPPPTSGLVIGKSDAAV